MSSWRPALLPADRAVYAPVPGQRYAITSSGAAVADCMENRIISSQNISADTAAGVMRAFVGLDGFPIIFSNGEALYRPELLNDPQHFGMDAYVDNFKANCTAAEEMERSFLAAPYPVEKLDFYFTDAAERAKFLARVQGAPAWVVPCESAGVEVNATGRRQGQRPAGAVPVPEHSGQRGDRHRRLGKRPPRCCATRGAARHGQRH